MSSPRRPVRVGRIVMALLVLGVLAVLAWFAINFFSVASGQLGFVWGGLVWLVLLGLPILVLGPPRRGRWLLGAAVVAALAGGVTWYSVPPTPERLAAAFEDEVRPPTGFTEAARDERGNTWCFMECPELTVAYDGRPGWSEQESSRRFGQALVEGGWQARSDGRGSYWTKWRWELRLSEDPDEGDFEVVMSG